MKITATQLRRIIREEAAAMMPTGGKDPQRFLHGSKSGHPHDDEGYMVKSRMASLKKMAADLCGLLDNEDQLPGWVQDHIAVSHENLQQVHGYLMGDEEMRSHNKSPQQMMPMESKSPRKGMMLEGHTRITPEEMTAWMGGDWGYVGEAFGGMMPGHGDKFKHPLKPPAPPKCADCGRKLLPVEKDTYEAEGGVGYPEVCMDCAEMPVRESSGLSEGHGRITEEEFSAWKNGDWGFVSEHDGGAPRKYRKEIPSDPMQLRDYVIRTYEGACADIGCDDVRDPEFKDYVADQLAGEVDSLVLQRALAMI